MADLKKIQVDGQLYDINVPDGKIGTDQLKDGRVALAENLVGRGSVPAEYTFRTAGGDADLGSGSALIKMLKGRTLVFNQLVGADTSSVTIPSGHKYISYIDDGEGNVTKSIGTSDGTAIAVTGGTDQVFDLTLMGIASAISTVADFKALFPRTDYAYNAGELLSVKATGIKTVGFNQWDEEWEVATSTDGNLWGDVNGKLVKGIVPAYGPNLESKNLIPCLPNTSYYFRYPGQSSVFDSGYVGVLFADADMNILGGGTTSGSMVISPQSAAYMAFFITSAYGTTYNHDICINLSWSGYRNGEYEPYWSETRQLPITTLTGKKDGEGESVVIFGDGLKSAGSVFDEITANGAVKRIGKVDLGSLEWIYYAESGHELMYSTDLIGIIKGFQVTNIANIVSSKFIAATINQVYDHTVEGIGINESGQIDIYAADMGTDAAAFKSAMSGVYLYYELATPETYVLDEPLTLVYEVDDFGTEKELPQNDDEPVTAPIRYEVQYAMNAVDTLRRLPVNYISKESMEAFLAELDSTLGTALSATVETTMSWDADNEKYTFSMTVTPNAEPEP